MPLLLRSTLILQQDPVDDPGERVELRTRRWPAPPVPGRYRKRQHLGHRSRVNPKAPRRLPPAHTLNLNRITNLRIELPPLHPPAPAACRQRPFAAGFLLRRPARLPGRFSEGLLPRRFQAHEVAPNLGLFWRNRGVHTARADDPECRQVDLVLL